MDCLRWVLLSVLWCVLRLYLNSVVDRAVSAILLLGILKQQNKTLVTVRYCSLGYFSSGFIFAEFVQIVILREIRNSAKIYQLN